MLSSLRVTGDDKREPSGKGYQRMLVTVCMNDWTDLNPHPHPIPTQHKTNCWRRLPALLLSFSSFFTFLSLSPPSLPFFYSPFLPLCLCLSFSHSFKHTHAHTYLATSRLLVLTPHHPPFLLRVTHHLTSRDTCAPLPLSPLSKGSHQFP